jgi:hypothetical protein
MVVTGTILMETVILVTALEETNHLATVLEEATSLVNIRQGTVILANILGRTSRLVAVLEATFLLGTSLLETASLENTLEVTSLLGIITMGRVIQQNDLPKTSLLRTAPEGTNFREIILLETDIPDTIFLGITHQRVIPPEIIRQATNGLATNRRGIALHRTIEPRNHPVVANGGKGRTAASGRTERHPRCPLVDRYRSNKPQSYKPRSNRRPNRSRSNSL